MAKVFALIFFVVGAALGALSLILWFIDDLGAFGLVKLAAALLALGFAFRSAKPSV